MLLISKVTHLDVDKQVQLVLMPKLENRRETRFFSDVLAGLDASNGRYCFSRERTGTAFKSSVRTLSFEVAFMSHLPGDKIPCLVAQRQGT